MRKLLFLAILLVAVTFTDSQKSRQFDDFKLNQDELIVYHGYGSPHYYVGNEGLLPKNLDN